MIARHLIEEQPAGAGWFLDASEPQALINSLASAWAAETGDSDSKLDQVDRHGLAQAALGRLRDADGGWTVVLDNADGDPGKLRKLLPVPEPGRGRRVVVTTTNPDWETETDYRWVSLPGIEETVLGPDLAELVRGRRLMLEAFRALLDVPEMTEAEIARRAPEPGGSEKEEELRGPVAYWEALRECGKFGDDWLRLCAFIAYLPPDHQPVEVLSTLAGGGMAALGALEQRGLIVRDEGENLRIHRLFVAAVRRYLDDEQPRLRNEVAYGIGADERAIEVLDRYGDLETVAALDDLLAAIDAEAGEVDERLGLAQHGVAGLLERFGQTPLSGKAFERAQRHLEGDPRKVADCLLGRARPINQHATKDPVRLREAVVWARSARGLLETAEERDEVETDWRKASAPVCRCLAMEGLLTRALSHHVEGDETPGEVLHRARKMLENADLGRQDNIEVEEVEKARSRFNLGGTWLELAKVEPEHAVAHLGESQRIYEEVLERRRGLYPVDIHPHVAACQAGLGFVNYYRAILTPGSDRQRTAWLRAATDHTVAALKQRETLDGSVDIDEAKKTSAFLAKVVLARLATPDDPATAPGLAFDEAMKELASWRP